MVWSVDSRGSLSAVRQYRKKGMISSLVYCILQPRAIQMSDNNADPNNRFPNRTAKGELKPQNSTPSFFFSTNGADRGGVIFADDLGHCTDVQQLSSQIDTMMFFEERSRLVILTRSLLLLQYYVSDDGRVSRVMQVKLSVPKGVADNVRANTPVTAAAAAAAAARPQMIIISFPSSAAVAES